MNSRVMLNHVNIIPCIGERPRENAIECQNMEIGSRVKETRKQDGWKYIGSKVVGLNIL